ncbi:cardiolipin synthase C [Candidatus Hakubella thermalkaliphila]|uniref:Cardiolipin synthase C n=1 Tax=Candidatus Hakubella thermalkaliphila TaxID=2754717 RepID=A0A6V8PGM8_9ACTN|nr:cardiolipin synthase C [Candidatus Hakubella thermalkaliphila]
MEGSSLVIGMRGVMPDVLLEIARLPGLTTDLLALIERALLLVCGQDGVVSVHTVQSEVQDRLPAERLAAFFFALTRAGALTRLKRDRRGHSFDQYRVQPDHLRQTIYDVGVARRLLKHVKAEEEQTGEVELCATFSKSLPLDTQIRQSILSLAAVLHRLITEAEQEILILNPFFERAGFDCLASALLAAANRGAATTIVTYQLSNLGSVNHQVLSSLARQAATLGLGDHFTFWEYEQIEERRVVPAAHAKVLLSDGKSAYIGSANLTGHGMARLLEIGVLLPGSQVGQLRQVFRAILESDNTQQVHIEKLII